MFVLTLAPFVFGQSHLDPEHPWQDCWKTRTKRKRDEDDSFDSRVIGLGQKKSKTIDSGFLIVDIFLLCDCELNNLWVADTDRHILTFYRPNKLIH